jgi:hypothetical protein
MQEIDQIVFDDLSGNVLQEPKFQMISAHDTQINYIWNFLDFFPSRFQTDKLNFIPYSSYIQIELIKLLKCKHQDYQADCLLLKFSSNGIPV